MHLPQLCLAVAILVCSQTVSAKTISRLQYRFSSQDSWAVTESIFHSFSSNYYLLQIYDRQHDNKTGSNIERHELYLGSALKLNDSASTPYGIVARVQKWSSFEPIISAGFELSFDRMETLSEVLKRYETSTFLQFFVKTKAQQLGRTEILHYYQINNLFDTSLYVRGYNIYYIGENEQGRNLLNSFADFIYPLHKNWDVYSRWNYLSGDSPQLGAKGHTASIGIRFNF